MGPPTSASVLSFICNWPIDLQQLTTEVGCPVIALSLPIWLHMYVHVRWIKWICKWPGLVSHDYTWFSSLSKIKSVQVSRPSHKLSTEKEVFSGNFDFTKFHSSSHSANWSGQTRSAFTIWSLWMTEFCTSIWKRRCGKWWEMQCLPHFPPTITLRCVCACAN